MTSNKSVLGALKDSEEQVEEIVGMVVMNDELLQQVSGGIPNGYINTVSAECWGFSCNLHPY